MLGAKQQRARLFVLGPLLALLCLAVCIPLAAAVDVILTWERPEDPRVRGYEVYYGSASSDFKTFPQMTISSALQTNVEIHGLEEGVTYAFAAKSIDARGKTSIFSETVYYEVPVSEEVTRQETGSTGNISDESVSGGGGCLIGALATPWHTRKQIRDILSKK
jgi:hypothetical protein